MKRIVLIMLIAVATMLSGSNAIADQNPALTYPIVDTAVINHYDNNAVIQAPGEGDVFYGQDAHYNGAEPSYADNGDATVTDQVTGLMWQQDMGEKLTFYEAVSLAETMTLGGHNDWRVPTVKELYSLILFTGSNGNMSDESTYVRYIDTEYFEQPFGDLSAGERIIDAQTWSSTEYVGTTMKSDATVFGVNFIDGRIKGYPKYKPATNNVPNAMYFRFVRGNVNYGRNALINNSDGTVTDLATGLMWQQADDGEGRDWENALSYAEQLELAGHSDWRLPNAKELQSLVDYSRSPQTTDSPAIDPVFSTTEISDPEGNPGQYPYFWTSTTHIDGIKDCAAAVYIAFGEAQGEMHGELMDVHGAGAQRSDPKSGNPDDYPLYWGPQGDVRYVFNSVRCVRDVSMIPTGVNDCSSCEDNPQVFRVSAPYPNPFNPSTTINYELAAESHVTLAIYDILGREISVLEDGMRSPGSHESMWHGRTKNGEFAASGVYLYKFLADTFSHTGKVMFVR